MTIKHRPNELKEGIHNVNIDSFRVIDQDWIRVYVRNHRLKGYKELYISLYDTDMIIKFFSILFDINELKKNPDICAEIQEEDFEGLATYVKLIRNEYGNVVLEDILDEETAKEQKKIEMERIGRELNEGRRGI